MKKKCIATACAAAIVVSLWSTSASAISISIGDFSFEDAMPPGLDYNPNDPVPGLSAWDYGGSAGIVGQQGPIAENTLASDGIYIGFLQNSASIAQNIIDPTLTPLNGQTLYFSFDAAGRESNLSPGQLTFTTRDIGGGNPTVIGSILPPPGVTGSIPTQPNLRILKHYEFAFTMPAFGGALRLELSHANTTPGIDPDVATIIDNVRLTTESTIVPEPSSFLLLSFVGLCSLAMRRKY